MSFDNWATDFVSELSEERKKPYAKWKLHDAFGVISSTSFAGRNQVEGLPPASSSFFFFLVPCFCYCLCFCSLLFVLFCSCFLFFLGGLSARDVRVRAEQVPTIFYGWLLWNLVNTLNISKSVLILNVSSSASTRMCFWSQNYLDSKTFPKIEIRIFQKSFNFMNILKI